jgi:hypothetical protein
MALIVKQVGRHLGVEGRPEAGAGDPM